MNEIEKKLRRYVPWAMLAGLLALAGYGILSRPAGYQPSTRMPADDGHGHDNATAGATTAKQKLYMCPMNDIKPRPEPGRCPVCGMDLVPVPEDQAGSGDGATISLSAAAQKLAQVQTSPVRRGFAEVEVRLGGKVGFDETRERVISAWVPGRLEKVFVDNTGTLVKKGEPLVEIYSQKLNGEKAIYISTLNDKPLSGESPERRRQLNRARLTLLGLTSDQIDELEKRKEMRYTELILAPISGTVVEKAAKQGMYVNEGEMLYKVADLSVVWVWLEAYESDLPFIRYGQDVEIHTPAFGNEKFAGMVSFIEPVLNDQTRTARVRVQVDNHDYMLKPNMIVRAVIQARVGASGGIVPAQKLLGKWICPRHPEVVRDQPGRCDESGLALLSTEALGYVTQSEPQPALLVPASAVLFTGKRGFVYRQDKDGKKAEFTGVEVELGPRAGDDYVIKSGLQEGERVASHGAFRIDSALQLMGKPSMMHPALTAEQSSPKTTDAPLQTDGKIAPAPEEHPGPAAVPMLNAPASFKEDIVKLFRQYYLFQRALGDDDFALAQREMAAVAAATALLNAAPLTPGSDARALWDKSAARLTELGKNAAASKDIEELRVVFVPVSAVFEGLARGFGPFPGLDIRRAFCPMAFGNNGAYWLQEGTIIHNPYEGRRMLKCGSLKEQLSGDKP